MYEKEVQRKVSGIWLLDTGRWTLDSGLWIFELDF